MKAPERSLNLRQSFEEKTFHLVRISTWHIVGAQPISAGFVQHCWTRTCRWACARWMSSNISQTPVSPSSFWFTSPMSPRKGIHGNTISTSKRRRGRDLGKEQKRPFIPEDPILQPLFLTALLAKPLAVCFPTCTVSTPVPNHHQQAFWFLLLFREACMSLQSVESLLRFWINVLNN